jgi:hypothetical protein
MNEPIYQVHSIGGHGKSEQFVKEKWARKGR